MAVVTPIPPHGPPPPAPCPPAVGGGRIARASDTLLAFCVLAFAVWTLAYHACLVLGLGSVWALVALAAGLVPCGRLSARHEAGCAPAPGAGRRTPDALAPTSSGGRAPLALAALGLALAAAAMLAFAADLPWPLRWAPWPAAAIAALLAGARGPLLVRPDAGAGAALAWAGAGAGAALAWAAGLAALALLLVKPNADDAYYLRQAAWVGEHGRFPLGDTLHSHDVLPAAFSPPLPSFEGLVGTLAGAAGVSAPALAHLVVAPLAVRARRARAVAAAARVGGPDGRGRAERGARVPAVRGRAAARPRRGRRPHAGDFFVARLWQGKVILVAVLVPLLFALLHGYAARPSRAGARAARGRRRRRGRALDDRDVPRARRSRWPASRRSRRGRRGAPRPGWRRRPRTPWRRWRWR